MTYDQGVALMSTSRSPEKLLYEMPPEAGEIGEFQAALEAAEVQIPPHFDAKRVFEKARKDYLHYDPRRHRLTGEALEVPGDWPTPELIATVCVYQQTVLRKAMTGVLEMTQLASALAAKSSPSVSENADLFEGPKVRSATAGRRAPVAALKNQYNARTEPVFGVGFKPGAGVNDELMGRLKAAEATLLPRMAADIDAHAGQVHPVKGAPLTKTPEDLRFWLDIRETHLGYRAAEDQGYHKTGSAVDFNYHQNPWATVRTRKVIGGEAAFAGMPDVAEAALDVMDRATLWFTGHRAEVNVSNRPDGDDPAQLAAWAGGVWRRFEEVGSALASYFALAYDVDRDAARADLSRSNEALRAAGKTTHEGESNIVRYADLLSSVPRRATQDALQRINDSMGSGRPWTKDAPRVLARMGSDLQAIAKIMVRGNPSRRPGKVRNPLTGIMDLKGALVEALVGAGLHWGACEFGASQSGDLMHFDLGRVPSFANQNPALDPHGPQGGS